MPNDSIFEPDELVADAQGAEGETPQHEQPRSPDGKFAPKEAGEEAPGDPDPDVNDTAPDAEGDKSGTVPQGALHAERERRKQVERDLATARETLANIQRLRDEAAARKPVPLPAADDPAAMEHLRSRLEEQGQQINRFSQQQELRSADEAEAQQLGTVMESGEAEFRQTTPDYDAAISHVIQARASELREYKVPDAQIAEIITQEAREIVKTAVQQNRNPAELAYAIAKSRGYRPTQVEQPANNGAQATLDAIGKARQASKSLGSGGGSSTQTLNAEAIAKMSDDEFDQLYSTAEGRKIIDGL